jgi:hypothetical protein
MLVLGFLEVKMKYFSGLLLVIAMGLVSCASPCSSTPILSEPFRIFGNYFGRVQEIPSEFQIFTQPYDLYYGCGDSRNKRITPKNVTYYNGSNVIGSTMNGGTFDDIVIWKAAPGKDGVPLTGTCLYPTLCHSIYLSVLSSSQSGWVE